MVVYFMLFTRFKKSQAPILAGVIYMVIVLIGISIVISAFYPKMIEMKEYSKVKKTLECYNNIENSLNYISLSSVGSSREIKCEINKGFINIEKNTIKFIFKDILYSYLNMFDPSKYYIGEGVVIYDNKTHYLMENKYLQVNVSKLNNKIDSIDNIIIGIVHKPSNVKYDKKFNFTVNNGKSLTQGIITTYPMTVNKKTNRGKIVVEVKNNNTEYNLSIILPSDADYLIFSLENN